MADNDAGPKSAIYEVDISSLNWTTGFFRLWLSASILWWVAISASVVAEASRASQAEYWRSQGIECSLDTTTPLFAFQSACQPSAGETSIQSLPLTHILQMTAERLQTGDHWTLWLYLVWVPLGVLLAAILIRRWVGWVRRGFAPDSDAGRANECAAGDDPHPDADMHGIGVEAENSAERAEAVEDREHHLRTNLVQAIQNLNKLDDELAELDPRLVGSSKKPAQELRQAIPGLGRRLIALVQTLGKEGLAPDNLLCFRDPLKAHHDSDSL